MSIFSIKYFKSVFSDNFGVVKPDLLRSKQPNFEKLKELVKTYHLGVVINLKDELEGYELRDTKRLGLDFWHVPMLDDAKPSPKSVRFALDLMRGPKVKLIHCKGGRHRTGVVLACYRVVVDRWPKEMAWEESEKLGWYDEFGHKPIRKWFEDEFKPEDYR